MVVGDSLLGFLVELLAKLQWRDTVLSPVLIVGLQDLIIKLLGSCNNRRMDNGSVPRVKQTEV